MCFAPQRRALFRHLNFQKWSENGVFCTFWLGNVLRATTACNFSSLLWPAGSAPAALASLLFDPPEPPSPKSLEKHSESRLSYLFAHLHLLSSYSFSSTLLSSDLSLLSASALLCFSSVHIIGSLTSKLPSIIYIYICVCVCVCAREGRVYIYMNDYKCTYIAYTIYIIQSYRGGIYDEIRFFLKGTFTPIYIYIYIYR